MARQNKRRIPSVAHRTPVRVAFDNGMYLVALVTPMLTIPQLLIVWTQRRIDGVSILTWGAYAAMSGVWLIYGLLNKQRQLILSQTCLFILDFGVVLGIFVFRQ